jgi:hypothetical protein
MMIKIIFTSLLVLVMTTFCFGQKKVAVKQKVKSSAKNNSNNFLTEEMFQFYLTNFTADAANDIKLNVYANAIEEAEVKRVEENICNCYQENFAAIKKATTKADFDYYLEKCMHKRLEDEMKATAPKLGKALDDEEYLKDFSSKVFNLLQQQKCKPFFWLFIQTSMLQCG